MQQDFTQHVNNSLVTLLTKNNIDQKTKEKPVKCQYLLYKGYFLKRYFFFHLENKHTSKPRVYTCFLLGILWNSDDFLFGQHSSSRDRQSCYLGMGDTGPQAEKRTWRSFGSLEIKGCLGNLQPSCLLKSPAKERRTTPPAAERLELGLAQRTTPQTEGRELSEVTCQVFFKRCLKLWE